MDHEAYENQMIDAINQHGEEVIKETAKTKLNRIVNKNDARTVATGLKRTVLALLTAAMFAVAVIGFITTASAHGYLAVIMFFASILALLCSYILLYAQGITRTESKGERK